MSELKDIWKVQDFNGPVVIEGHSRKNDLLLSWSKLEVQMGNGLRWLRLLYAHYCTFSDMRALSRRITVNK